MARTGSLGWVTMVIRSINHSRERQNNKLFGSGASERIVAPPDFGMTSRVPDKRLETAMTNLVFCCPSSEDLPTKRSSLIAIRTHTLAKKP